MAPRNDLGLLYAKHMEHFGCGLALFQPVSATDMCPPCVGYLDDNMRWNLIANIEWPGHCGLQAELPGFAQGLKPLERPPRKLEQLNIEWRPRTSIGVRQYTVDASGQTPDTGLPVGADAHIKYQSKSKFGAVLITRKPITLISYNDETLFQSWLAANKSQLSSLHGAELRRYGLRIITRTYTSPGCSIRAWDSKDKETIMSVKAKADMAGELGTELNYTDKSLDKDWSHYCGNDKGDTVVVFFDGIEVPASSWWCESLRRVFRRDSADRSHSEEGSLHVPSRYQRNTPLLSPRDMEEKGLLNEDLWGSPDPLRRGRSVNSRRSMSRSRQPSSNREKSVDKGVSTPKRLARYLEYDQRLPAIQIQSEPVSPGSVTNTVRVARPHRTRFLVPDPPNRAVSTASSATSAESLKVRKPIANAVNVTQSGPPTPKLRSALHRRDASPQLRHTE